MNSISAWSLGPFSKLDDANPVLGPGDGIFHCPFLGQVKWDDCLLIYSGCNSGDPALPPGAYSAGQALFDPVDPTAVIGRTNSPFLFPQHPFELEGEIPNVCFIMARLTNISECVQLWLDSR